MKRRECGFLKRSALGEIVATVLDKITSTEIEIIIKTPGRVELLFYIYIYFILGGAYLNHTFIPKPAFGLPQD